MTFLFQEIEESDNVFRLDMDQVELRNRPSAVGCHKAEEQRQGITVAVDGVRTQPPQTREVVGEERAQSAAQ